MELNRLNNIYTNEEIFEYLFGRKPHIEIVGNNTRDLKAMSSYNFLFEYQGVFSEHEEDPSWSRDGDSVRASSFDFLAKYNNLPKVRLGRFGAGKNGNGVEGSKIFELYKNILKKYAEGYSMEEICIGISLLHYLKNIKFERGIYLETIFEGASSLPFELVNKAYEEFDEKFDKLIYKGECDCDNSDEKKEYENE